MKTQHDFIENGTKVVVTFRSGKKMDGIIRGGDYNVCTFEKEYDVEYFYEPTNSNRIMICVPERAIAIA